MNKAALWQRYQDHLCQCPSVGLKLDISRIPFDDGFFDRMEPAMQAAYDAMAQLEAGRIANPDESRMVGHYWLRAPQLAPDDDIRAQIQTTVDQIESFAADLHAKRITPPGAARFTDLVLVGIGGSALGPQLVADALGAKRDKITVHFLDNTDPDGVDRIVDNLGARLKSTLVVVISKSGGTKETRNGMLEMEHAFSRRGLEFAPQAVAVTGDASELDQYASNRRWLRRFPMWDWVGGRTSVMSAVGLVPAALQGIDIRAFLEGAKRMDEATRIADTRRNPAARLALMWHAATDGRGSKDMVILPYKDRLLLMSRYLQQLVMESLGKDQDLDGNSVQQGIAVYGNKGSTDQHAYVQQLREGPDDCFVTFLAVREDRRGTSREVEPGITSGDYLHSFWLGTRAALTEAGRRSVSLVLDQFTPRALGALIALFERTVGYYAALISINAYHQPGIEAGKAAANEVLQLQQKLLGVLRDRPSQGWSAETLAETLAQPQSVELVFHLLEHLAANQRLLREAGQTPFDATFRISGQPTPAL